MDGPVEPSRCVRTSFVLWLLDGGALESVCTWESTRIGQSSMPQGTMWRIRTIAPALFARWTLEHKGRNEGKRRGVQLSCP